MPAAMDSRPPRHRRDYVGRTRGLRESSGSLGVGLKGNQTLDRLADMLLDSFLDRPLVEQLDSPKRDSRDSPRNLD